MAQYTKEIKLSTGKGLDYTKTITGNYNVVFDKVIKVDNSNAGIDLVNYGTSVANDTMTAPKAILVENTGDVGAWAMFRYAFWSAAATDGSADYIIHHFILPGDEIRLPATRAIIGDAGIEPYAGTAVSSTAPNNLYLDSGTKLGENVEDSDTDFAETNNNEKDELYNKAVDIIKSEGKASTSFLQRKLQIGYNRAARIMETMEKEGIVGQANHVGKREIL